MQAGGPVAEMPMVIEWPQFLRVGEVDGEGLTPFRWPNVHIEWGQYWRGVHEDRIRDAVCAADFIQGERDGVHSGRWKMDAVYARSAVLSRNPVVKRPCVLRTDELGA